MQNQFTPRNCRRCNGEGQRPGEAEDTCLACGGSGCFEAKLKEGWVMPAKPVPQCYPEAMVASEEWECSWRDRDGEEYGEIEWPFLLWADAEDFKRLGFRVVTV